MVHRLPALRGRRAVAIKVLSRELAKSEGAKTRFLREAQAASALDHPNIGVIHDVWVSQTELFIVMALYEGQTTQARFEEDALQ